MYMLCAFGWFNKRKYIITALSLHSLMPRLHGPLSLLYSGTGIPFRRVGGQGVRLT
jgi:hypothetical protein